MFERFRGFSSAFQKVPQPAKLATVELVQPEVLNAAAVSAKVTRVRLAGPRLELVAELPIE